jgi:hypothetical protein
MVANKPQRSRLRLMAVLAIAIPLITACEKKDTVAETKEHAFCMGLVLRIVQSMFQQPQSSYRQPISDLHMALMGTMDRYEIGDTWWSSYADGDKVFRAEFGNDANKRVIPVAEMDRISQTAIDRCSKFQQDAP